MLYLEMRSNGMNGRLNTWPTLATLDDKGNPYRFIDYKKKSIGYNNKTSKYVINPDGITKDDVASIMTEIRKL